MMQRSVPFVLALALVVAGCEADSPTNPSGSTDVTLLPTGMGSIRSDGFVFNEPNVGDGALDRAHQAFLRFDLSSIPDDATIDEVSVDFGDHTVVGDPFSWGCLDAYPATVFPLDSGDYLFAQPASGDRLFNWCTAGELAAGDLLGDRLRTAVETRVGTMLELRLQIDHKQFLGARSNSDGMVDQLQFGMPELIITYSES